MSYSVCIDIGGTFTDCVVMGSDARMNLFKSPSTPPGFERGFMDVLEIAATHYGVGLRPFLEQTATIVHGTTVSTNALVEGKTSPVGLICNEGHPDILLYREAPRKRAWNWRLDYPPPYVPRNRTCEVRGRIDAMGREVEPLSEQDVRAAVDHLRQVRIEAIAVALLWSVANPAHEVLVRDIIHSVWPDVPVTLSHELNPIPREYRRAMSTAIDASLVRVFSDYLGHLESALADAGYAGELLVANCVGGMMPADEIRRKPIYSVMSGPTLAPIAALHITDHPDVVVMDMGGTTFDVSAVRGRRLVLSRDALILPYDMLGLPKVDVRSIGAGGGSIASVDVGGLLRVGPQSAGAEPGPACYGKGGVQPTVTDANVVLGIIDPDNFLGGRIRLDRSRAEQAVGDIATALGIGLVDAAYAIHTTSNHGMIAAIEDVTVHEGLNPRECYFVAGGGATGAHIAGMARILGARQFMVPKFSAALSAFGGLISDVRWEAVASLQTDSRRISVDAVNALLAGLRKRCEAFLVRAGVPAAQRSFAYSFQGRYEYQTWEIDVPFETERCALRASDVAALVAAFNDEHERIYSFRDEDSIVEFITWKVMAIGVNAAADGSLPKSPPGPTGALTPRGQRKVYVHEAGGMTDVAVYDGTHAGEGTRIAGPAVIEEPTTTILLLPHMVATVDAYGNYLVTG